MLKLKKKIQDVVIAGKDTTLIAWDYDERLFKKLKFLSKPILEKNDIKTKELEAEWPHISAVYETTPDMTKEERDKFSLAADLVKPEFKYKDLAIFKGQKDDFFAIEYDVPPQFEKFIKFAEDVCGKDRIKRWYKNGKVEDRPHVSIWAINKQDTVKVTKEILDEIKQATKAYLRPFIPAKVSFWDDFEISRIEQLSSGTPGKNFKSQVMSKYKILIRSY
jgi:hypothetical protein